MVEKNDVLAQLAFTAAAIAILTLSGCANRSGDYHPSIIGPPSFNQTEKDVQEQEKALKQEIKEYKFSEEELRQIDKLNNDPKYADGGGLMRRLRDENGERIRDFIEGLYYKEHGQIYVNFLLRPVHENQIGIINVASSDNVRIKVPVEEAFLISREILKEWREHLENDIRQGESYMFLKGMATGAALKAEAHEIEAARAQENALDFLGIRPTKNFPIQDKKLVK